MGVSDTLAITIKVLSEQAEKALKDVTRLVDKFGDESQESAREVDKLDRGMKGTTLAARGLSAGLKSIYTSLGPLFAVLAPIVTIGGISNALVGSAQEIDRIGDLAAQLNVSTEAISRYGIAAQFAGSSQGEFESALEKLTLRIGQARNGNKQIAKEFKDAGIAFKDSSGAARDSADVLLDLSDAILKTSDASERAVITSKLLGQAAGPGLVQFLSIGREGIEELTASYDRFGLVVSKVQGESVGELVDSFDRLKLAVRGVFTQAVIRYAEKWRENFDLIADYIVANREALLDFVEQVRLGIIALVEFQAGLVAIGTSFDLATLEQYFKLFKELILSIGGVIRSFVDDIANHILDKIEYVLSVFLAALNAFAPEKAKQIAATVSFAAMQQLTPAILALTALQNHGKEVAVGAAAYFAPYIGGLAAISTKAGEAVEMVKALPLEPINLNFDTVDSTKALDEFATKFKAFTDFVRSKGREILPKGAEYTDMAEINAVNVDDQEAQLSFWDKIIAKLMQVDVQLRRIAQGLSDGFADGLEQIKAQIRDISGTVSGDVVGAFGAMRGAAVSAFASIIDGSASAADAAKMFFKAILAALVQLAAQLLVTIALALVLNALGFGLPAAGGSAATVGGTAFNNSTGASLGAGLRRPGGSTTPELVNTTNTGRRAAGGQTNITINAMDSKSFAAFISQEPNARALAGVNRQPRLA